MLSSHVILLMYSIGFEEARWCSGLGPWTFNLEVGGFRPGLCHRVVS